MSEMSKEKVVENLSEGIKKMIDIQWELAELELLDEGVRETLLRVGEYYVQCLLVVDPLAALDVISGMKTAEERSKDLTGN